MTARETEKERENEKNSQRTNYLHIFTMCLSFSATIASNMNSLLMRQSYSKKKREEEKIRSFTFIYSEL